MSYFLAVLEVQFVTESAFFGRGVKRGVDLLFSLLAV